MQTNSRLFDDLARLATGALGTAQGVKTEWENLFHQRLERFISEMDLVPREEFDAVKAMATLAREENDALKERLTVLEEKIEALSKTPRPRKAAPAKAKSTTPKK
ncbi:accessory factor UbiK family protein [Sneathiella sp. HT1-7]|uniref:accessory factor UbiK family protein n=1 Tax=Sneathiella sp. HT1-7 TaxID=2887192 RepID=UPI001D13AEE3|nr:accessory factor UbiK family protein [Sneathiella sp. HT1-7]MCC3306685.1 accessory factor UbiK family protein [Sneathiella sp. HT1-7]